MNLLYIGSGFVGACSAAVSADSGHKVLVYDIDARKIELLSSGDRDTIQSCLFEEGLGDLLIRNKDKINFTADYALVEKFLDDADAVFMCLPTPEIGESGESDLSFYFSAAEKLAAALAKRNVGAQSKYVVIVNKSTVPVEMIERTEEMMEKTGARNYGAVSNPEFLVEGKAIEGSIRPERVVVGAWKEKDFEIMRRIYQRFLTSANIKYIEVNPKEAAAGKLLANFYLLSRLALCFDVIGRACETFADLRFENVRQILTSDSRIGSWGLYDSLYAGGSCLVKDARSLSHQLRAGGRSVDLVNAVYLANRRQLESFLARPEKEAGFDWSGKKAALLGLAFKQGTNDARNSPSVDIVNFLLEKKIKEVGCYDPAASEEFKKYFPESERIKYSQDEAGVLEGAEAIIIAADWPQFRGLGDHFLNLNGRPLIMDGRRILERKYEELRSAGFDIIAVGSPFIKAK